MSLYIGMFHLLAPGLHVPQVKNITLHCRRIGELVFHITVHCASSKNSLTSPSFTFSPMYPLRQIIFQRDIFNETNSSEA